MLTLIPAVTQLQSGGAIRPLEQRGFSVISLGLKIRQFGLSTLDKRNMHYLISRTLLRRHAALLMRLVLLLTHLNVVIFTNLLKKRKVKNMMCDLKKIWGHQTFFRWKLKTLPFYPFPNSIIYNSAYEKLHRDLHRKVWNSFLVLWMPLHTKQSIRDNGSVQIELLPSSWRPLSG